MNFSGRPPRESEPIASGREPLRLAGFHVSSGAQCVALVRANAPGSHAERVLFFFGPFFRAAFDTALENLISFYE
jgi:hypothetical protein